MTRILYDTILGAILMALAIGSNASGSDTALSDNQGLSQLLDVTSKLTSNAEDQLTNLIDSGHTSLEDTDEATASEEPLTATAEMHAVGLDENTQSQLGESDPHGWTKVGAASPYQSTPRIEEFEDTLPDKLFPSISSSIDPLVQEASENLSRAAWEFVHPLSPSPPPSIEMDEMMPPVAEEKVAGDTLKAANKGDQKTTVKMGITDMQKAKRNVKNTAAKATTHDVKHSLAHVIATELPDTNNKLVNDADPDVVVTKLPPAAEVKGTQSTADKEHMAVQHDSTSQLQTSNKPSGGANTPAASDRETIEVEGHVTSGANPKDTDAIQSIETEKIHHPKTGARGTASPKAPQAMRPSDDNALAASDNQPTEVGHAMRDTNTKEVDAIQSTDTKAETAHSENQDTNKDANARVSSKMPMDSKALQTTTSAMLATGQSADAEMDQSGLQIEQEETLAIPATDVVQPERPIHQQQGA